MSKRRPGRAAALLLGMLAGAAAQAADADGNLAIKGIGLAACGDYVEALDARDARLEVFFGWASGYLTAVNRYESGVYDVIDWQSDGYIALSLRGWCVANPERRFFDAVFAMTQSLLPAAVDAESPLVSVGDIRLYRSTLDRVRERLEALGHYDPAAHGADLLEASLISFQSARGLPPTGLPDTATLFALFSED